MVTDKENQELYWESLLATPLEAVQVDWQLEEEEIAEMHISEGYSRLSEKYERGY